MPSAGTHSQETDPFFGFATIHHSRDASAAPAAAKNSREDAITSNGQTDPKSGMLAFDEETGRKMEAVYLTSEAAARRQALRGSLRIQSGDYGLYIGSGPGFAPCEIAQALGPDGRLAVVEKNAAMLS